MRVVDSHTEGEPTRVILDGGPPLGSGPLAERARVLSAGFDKFLRATIAEPRGSEALVGALLCAPVDRTCVTGVIFFNRVGPLGMCGHATIGTAVTLAFLGRIGPGTHRIETPAGVVTARLTTPNVVSVENVESFRYRRAVCVNVEGIGPVTGDVAWGGNWFFQTADLPCPLVKGNISLLSDAARRTRLALARESITGRDGAEIDHVEFFGPANAPDANSRNFVLCPDGTYDRSPCGTGTSAKLACLASDGELVPGKTWIQESITGSRFLASYRRGEEGGIFPTITGAAYICADAELRFDPNDPFAHGIRAA